MARPHVAAALGITMLCLAVVSPVSANYFYSVQLMCSPYGKYIGLGGDCCAYDGITIGWRKGAKCSKTTADCPVGDANWAKAWPAGGCKVQKVVCEKGDVPAIIVRKKNKDTWTVWKECADRKQNSGNTGLGIVLSSPPDDLCACPVKDRKLLQDDAAAASASDLLPEAEGALDG